ncbi:MAG: hypothetical protein OXU64_09005 [Gemmatimonadota bacterium]|nr:hypothetical protein [Gemmatimonadota bacterium]
MSQLRTHEWRTSGAEGGGGPGVRGGAARKAVLRAMADPANRAAIAVKEADRELREAVGLQGAE